MVKNQIFTSTLQNNEECLSSFYSDRFPILDYASTKFQKSRNTKESEEA